MSQKDDLISRQAVFDMANGWTYNFCDPEDEWAAMKEIRELPSADPERKRGKWIPFDIPWYKCSECGAVRENNSFMENFCPYCGADMRGE